MDRLKAAVLMCHAPIVIPAIGGSRGGECQATTRAMADAAEALVASGAETVVVLSPHLPRREQGYGWAEGSVLRGDFADFSHPGLAVSFPAAEGRPDGVHPVPGRALDHGSTVPLWFLAQAGFQGRVQVFGFPWRPDPAENQAFGRELRKLRSKAGESWALLASGDMSHALKPGGPAGFHPRAAEFEGAVRRAVATGELEGLSELPPELRRLAAEDVIDSLQVAAGALGGHLEAPRVLSYEAPFGVGYLVALLRGGS